MFVENKNSRNEQWTSVKLRGGKMPRVVGGVVVFWIVEYYKP